MNKNIPVVAVLMSTYNGEKYIKEQLESIFAQIDVKVNLYVRDDGSSDSTASILKSYKKKTDNIHLSFGRNVGVGNSFMTLVYNERINADYYAFADQDDIWLPEKLITAINRLQDIEGPALYAGNQTLIDSNGNVIRERYSAPVQLDYHRVLAGNKLPGCTMVFNDSLMRLLREKGRKPGKTFFLNSIHDVWIALAASIAGTTVYDNNSYILYRQHGDNVVGGFDKKDFLTVAKQKIKKISDKNIRYPRRLRAKEALKRFPDYIGPDKKDLNYYAEYTHNRKYKKWLLKDKQTIQYTNENPVEYKMKVLLNFI